MPVQWAAKAALDQIGGAYRLAPDEDQAPRSNGAALLLPPEAQAGDQRFGPSQAAAPERRHESAFALGALPLLDGERKAGGGSFREVTFPEVNTWVASEKARWRRPQHPGIASENTKRVRRGRPAAELSEPYATVLERYAGDLASAPLADHTRRTYVSRARQYLAWLAGAEVDGDPLGSVEGRDWAVRDYRTFLQAVLKRRPATVNNALAAVDNLYIRRGLAPANAKRMEIPKAAPRALDRRAQIRYLRAVEACSSPRDHALALVPFYAGARIAETVALDVDDVRLSSP